jgi:hypothetical protein
MIREENIFSVRFCAIKNIEKTIRPNQTVSVVRVEMNSIANLRPLKTVRVSFVRENVSTSTSGSE